MAGWVRALTSGVLLPLVMATWTGTGWIAGCKGSDSARRLFEDKLTNYNPLIRPVENTSDVLEVFIGFTLSQLIDIDEKKQIMITSLWLKQKWKDYKLSWNPDDYNGLQNIQVPIDKLWKPDIVLYNNAEGNYAVDVANRATVRHDGTVFWNPPVIFRSSCLIDISYFPFDEQRCKMKFGSWTHEGAVLDLNPLSERVERENYRPNGEWDIVESPITKNAIKYPCCEEIYIDVTFTFVLHRNPLFYTITMVLPCILIALLTVLVFYLPSAAQEKVTLSISVLIALIVFLLLIPSIVPPTSTTVPLITRYMLFTMAIVSLSIFATVWTLNVHFRNTNTHVMGSWTKKIFLGVLPRVLMMERPGAAEERKEREKQKQIEQSVIRSSVSSLFVYAPPDETASGRGKRESGCTGGYSKMIGATSTTSPSLQEDIEYRERSSTLEMYDDYKPVKMEWQGLLESLHYIQTNLKDTDAVEDSEEDWMFVGLVIDRLLLWIFLIVVVVGTAVFFSKAPIFWEEADVHLREVYEEPELILSAGYYDLFPILPATPPAVTQSA